MMETLSVFNSEKESPEVSREVVARGRAYLACKLGVTEETVAMIIEGGYGLSFDDKGFVVRCEERR